MSLWRIIRTLSISVEFVTLTFLLFLIWESTNNLNLILLFSLFYFISIPFGGFVSGYITDTISPKLALLICHVLQIFQLAIIIIFYGEFSNETLIILGLLGGLAEGMKNIAFNYIDISANYVQDAAKNFAGRTVIIKFTQLFLPLFAAYIVSQKGSYLLLFSITIVIHMILSILILFFNPKVQKSKFVIMEILNFPGKSEEKKILGKSAFFEGMFDGITLTVLPIVVLSFVGSVLNWGFLNTLLVLASIVVSIILAKLVSERSSQWVYAMGAVIFAAASILLIAQYNFYVIMVFLLAMSFMEIIKDVGYHAAIEKIIKRDREEYILVSEYKIIVQIFSSIGKLIPVIMLLFIGININNEFVIRLTLLIAGLLPLLVLSVLGQSIIFDAGYEENDHLRNARELEIPNTPRPYIEKEIHMSSEEDIPDLGSIEKNKRNNNGTADKT